MIDNKENKEMTFDELVSNAVKIGDRRRKIFGELAEKLNYSYIPALVKVMNQFDVKKCLFNLKTCPIAGFTRRHFFSEEKDYYGLCVSSDGMIYEAYMDSCNAAWVILEEYKYEYPEFMRSGVVELAEAIKQRIVELNGKYEKKNDVVETIVNENLKSAAV